MSTWTQWIGAVGGIFGIIGGCVGLLSYINSRRDRVRQIRLYPQLREILVELGSELQPQIGAPENYEKIDLLMSENIPWRVRDPLYNVLLVHTYRTQIQQAHEQDRRGFEWLWIVSCLMYRYSWQSAMRKLSGRRATLRATRDMRKARADFLEELAARRSGHRT
ncbi:MULTISPECIES: hypothetical protein [Streptomyces]